MCTAAASRARSDTIVLRIRIDVRNVNMAIFLDPAIVKRRLGRASCTGSNWDGTYFYFAIFDDNIEIACLARGVEFRF